MLTRFLPTDSPEDPSFEPYPPAAARLRYLARNDPDWEVQEIAVSSVSGSSTLNVMRNSQFNSLSTPRYDETRDCSHLNTVVETTQVETSSLTDVIAHAQDLRPIKRAYLKMDTQGYDMQIVQAAPEALRTFLAVQTEASLKCLYSTSTTIGDAIAWYAQQSYDVSAVLSNNGGTFSALIESDVVFVRRQEP